MTNSDDDDDVPSLPADTLAILQQFNEERWKTDDDGDMIKEDWQLSQFWYSEETARQLALELNYAAGDTGRIACISCPTVVQYFLKLRGGDLRNDEVVLFEYDHRFEKKFPSQYVPYDYTRPLCVPHYFEASFDVIIADPPYLSTECLEKTAQTVRFLGKTDAKIILCTGAIMEDMALTKANPLRCHLFKKFMRASCLTQKKANITSMFSTSNQSCGNRFKTCDELY
ncbi:EEF1A lysine methyltransferase 1 [Parelaphostrongylus tenuis]|uniref:EEF1A lysine methyltransferase 1 n=1 Tax=Parelaphostrongylus tenuis TaxID=148309 RepID=A0AAD5MB72_PARTN|nr:EEF1A lysine methyltransferase 1 [Parelaphostrongylus tenuis]